MLQYLLNCYSLFFVKDEDLPQQVDEGRREGRVVAVLLEVGFVHGGGQFFPALENERDCSCCHFVENAAERPDIVDLVVHLDGLRGRVWQTSLTPLHAFAFLEFR